MDAYQRCVVKYGAGRTDRYGFIVGETSTGDLRVKYDAGIEVTCRREHVHHVDMPAAWSKVLDSLSRRRRFVQ